MSLRSLLGILRRLRYKIFILILRFMDNFSKAFTTRMKCVQNISEYQHISLCTFLLSYFLWVVLEDDRTSPAKTIFLEAYLTMYYNLLYLEINQLIFMHNSKYQRIQVIFHCGSFFPKSWYITGQIVWYHFSQTHAANEHAI